MGFLKLPTRQNNDMIQLPPPPYPKPLLFNLFYYIGNFLYSCVLYEMFSPINFWGFTGISILLSCDHSDLWFIAFTYFCLDLCNNHLSNDTTVYYFYTMRSWNSWGVGCALSWEFWKPMRVSIFTPISRFFCLLVCLYTLKPSRVYSILC